MTTICDIFFKFENENSLWWNGWNGIIVIVEDVALWDRFFIVTTQWNVNIARLCISSNVEVQASTMEVLTYKLCSEESDRFFCGIFTTRWDVSLPP